MSRDRNPQIFIAKLSSSIRERTLEEEFKRFGPIRKIELKRGFAFVEYEDYRDADEAIRDMDGRKFEGNRIVVEHSRGKRRDRDRDRSERDDRDRRYPRKSGPQPDDVCFNCRKTGHWSNECREPVKTRERYYNRDRNENNSVSRSRSRNRSRSRSQSDPRRNRSNSRSVSNHRRRHSRRSESPRYGRSRSNSRSYSNKREKSENGNK